MIETDRFAKVAVVVVKGRLHVDSVPTRRMHIKPRCSQHAHLDAPEIIRSDGCV